MLKGMISIIKGVIPFILNYLVVVFNEGHSS